MSDDGNTPGRPKPPRAQPVQPDKPGSGNDAKTQAQDGSRMGEAGRTSARRQKKQSQAALDNVREGYD